MTWQLSESDNTWKEHALKTINNAENEKNYNFAEVVLLHLSPILSVPCVSSPALYCVHFFSNKESELLSAAIAKNPRRLMLGTLTHERECR